MSRAVLLALACLASSAHPLPAQAPDQPDAAIDAAARRQVIDGVLARPGRRHPIG